jgi:hypothetical protein
MFRLLFLALALFATSTLELQAQSTRNDIPVGKLPKEVRDVLVRYIQILRTSSDLDACATAFATIAGGSLVNEDGQTLRNNVKPYSLKKDFGNVKFYADPIRITRVNVSRSNGSGFGPSAIAGTVYKIWIDKRAGAGGVPAPISIMVPENHPTIKTPKIINIGSL